MGSVFSARSFGARKRSVRGDGPAHCKWKTEVLVAEAIASLRPVEESASDSVGCDVTTVPTRCADSRQIRSTTGCSPPTASSSPRAPIEIEFTRAQCTIRLLRCLKWSF
eukprot:1535661-Prymnesium_polylepis.1